MVIVNYKAGQLANRLFYFSHFISNSIEHNYRLVNTAFNDYKHFFPATSSNNFSGLKISTSITSLDSLDTFIRKSFHSIGKLIFAPLRKTSFYQFHEIRKHDADAICFDLNDRDYIKAAKSKMVFIDGWLYRDFRNFKKHAPFIRKIFTPAPAYLQEVQSIISHCKTLGDVVIGVHIRRGDYKTYRDGCWYYEDDVYAGKMQELKGLFAQIKKKCVFLICSNEEINKASFRGLTLVTGNRHFITDLYALSQCDYLIGPPSTYSMWASFYGETPLLAIDHAEKKFTLEDFEIVTEG